MYLLDLSQPSCPSSVLNYNSPSAPATQPCWMSLIGVTFQNIWRGPGLVKAELYYETNGFFPGSLQHG